MTDRRRQTATADGAIDPLRQVRVDGDRACSRSQSFFAGPAASRALSLSAFTFA